MLEQYVESLTDLIEALDGIEDRALNEKSYNFFIGSIKEEYEKILEESSIEKLYHEAVAIGTTKEELINDREAIRNKLNEVFKIANFSNVYKNQILNEVFDLIISVFDKVIEKYGNYVGTVLFEKTIEGARLPTYAHDEDACCDIYAPETIEIPANARGFKVNTGLRAVIPNNYELLIRSRSGMAMKTPLRISNGTGTIDSNYTGAICVLFDNLSDIPYVINANDRIAQFAFKPVYRFRSQFIDSVDAVKQTDRGEGGFGSSGA